MRMESKLFFLSDIFINKELCERYTVSRHAVDLLKNLKKDLELWLVLDLPRHLRGTVEDLTGLVENFHHLLYLDEAAPQGELSALLDYLEECSGAPREQCLLLDTDLKRCVAAINNRFPSAVIIDEMHLEREFLLRKLTGQEYTMHKKP